MEWNTRPAYQCICMLNTSKHITLQTSVMRHLPRRLRGNTPRRHRRPPAQASPQPRPLLSGEWQRRPVDALKNAALATSSSRSLLMCPIHNVSDRIRRLPVWICYPVLGRPWQVVPRRPPMVAGDRWLCCCRQSSWLGRSAPHLPVPPALDP